MRISLIWVLQDIGRCFESKTKDKKVYYVASRDKFHTKLIQNISVKTFRFKKLHM